MNIKGLSLISALSFLLNTVLSQNVASGVEKNIRWIESANSKTFAALNFGVSRFSFNQKVLPAISEVFETKTRAKIEFYDLVYENYTPANDKLKWQLKELTGQADPIIYHTLEGTKVFTGYYLCPFKESGGQYQRLTSYKIRVSEGEAFALPSAGAGQKRAAANSVLASGTWLKFSVTQDGLYKLSSADFQNAGVNIASIDPRKIKVYTHQGGMLPESNAAFRYDDLPELAIQVIGENDGVFNSSDYVLFYAESPTKWKYSATEQRYIHQNNIYSDKTFVFVTVDGNNGKRMSSLPDGQGIAPDASFNWFDYLEAHEEELENICNEGREFLGEKFDQKLIYNFTHSLANVTNNKTVKVYYEGAAVSPVNSTISLRMNNVNSASLVLGSLITDDECYMAGTGLNAAVAVGEIGSVSNLNLSFLYNQPVSTAKAWLNYYELHCSRALKMSESFMRFRNIQSAGFAQVEYRLSGLPNSYILLDVTDPVTPYLQNTFDDNSEKVFRNASGGKIRQFLLCDGNTMNPTFEGTVSNQNLHATGVVQFIIISHPDFLDASNKLADWHRTRDGMSVKVVTPQQIYNEFSSGSQDICAIRDYLKHVYYANTNPVNQLKYVLLMGDASFDYKDKMANNTNFVPVYESEPKDQIPFLGAEYYCSDDYFGFLDSTDGTWVNNEKMEIAVSRLPVASAEEAGRMVDKIIHYKAPESLGEWRSFISFCADDADTNWELTFVEDFENLYKEIDTTFKNVNVRKVYIDAFKQLNLGGSQRYPDAQLAIKKEFEQGTLIFNYVGHGGPEYLATEKVIDIPLINGLNNLNSLPAFFTATCEFSQYDNARHKSAGEYVITQPNGGAIAMFTTTRIVEVGANFALTEEFWTNCVYTKIGNKWPTLGDVYKRLKNWNGQNNNDRKFTLFADPALVLNYPEYVVKVDSMNSSNISPGKDTLKALSQITFNGHLEDIFGNRLNTFNGTLYPIVYDKPTEFRTLNNDNVQGGDLPFDLYSSILYKGKSSVSDGEWGFTFVVPKDINYTYGYGRLSLYADNGQKTDAWGNYREFYVGGASKNAVADVTGPDIELFVDDYNFISGGLTDNSPLLLARVYDEHGINTSGIGIGRDIVAIIDKGTPNEKRYVLNAFYTAKLNSFTTGDIRYQLDGISDGMHTYTLKVWDVYNNSSEATIEFLVKSSDEVKLEHVLNYPNPFSTNTVFHFDHNQSGQNLKVVISIMTITGKVIKTLEENVSNAPGHVSSLTWNGRDEYDDKLSKGVYIYRITVTTEDGRKAEIIEKLVILN